MTRCVGAFRILDCPNDTDTILCEQCYGVVDAVMNRAQVAVRTRAAAQTRRVYRRRTAVELPIMGEVR